MLAVSSLLCLASLWVSQVASSHYCPTGVCVSHSHCSPQYLASSQCLLAPATPGLCCPPSNPPCKPRIKESFFLRLSLIR